MLITGVAVLVGLIVGVALPPRPSHVARPVPRWLWLLALGVVAQVSAASIGGRPGLALVLGAYAMLIVFALRNSHVSGTGVLAIGLALNALVVAVNAGMPVHPQSLVDAGVVHGDQLATVGLLGHRHLEAGDHLMILDDRIPLPPARQVLSFGDLIIAVAAADVVAHVSRRRRRALAVTPVVDLRPSDDRVLVEVGA